MAPEIISLRFNRDRDRDYQIEISPNGLNCVGSQLASFDPISEAVIITDDQVSPLGYAQQVAESIAEAGIDAYILTIAAGEASKSIEMANSIWQALLEDGVDRKAVILAVGGGVIGDLVGFVAATYARGLRFFQVPTTLLAQVDSSVGGKVGIDLPNAKNMVGCFHQPIGVLIDPTVLKTLPEDQYRNGLGEVLKYAVSLDEKLLQFLESNVKSILDRTPSTLAEIIARCCQIKAKIVMEDEFETQGKRILLNFGHTFGHAVEIMSEFSILHGQAVAIGSLEASRLALKLNLIDASTFQRFEHIHQELGLPTQWPKNLDRNKMLELMMHDKKTQFGQLRLVLPTGAGKCQVVKEIDPNLLLRD